MAKNSVKPFELLTEYERLSLKHTVQLQEAEWHKYLTKVELDE